MKLWHTIKDPKSSGGIVVICTGVIALATVINGFISYFQWSAVSDANRINKESVQAVQRAFVTLNSFATGQLTKGDSAGGNTRYVEVTSNWENSGTTPAIGVMCSFVVDELPKGPTDEKFIAMSAPPTSSSYIGAKGSLPQTIRKPLSFYTGGRELADFTSTRNLDRKIFLWGWMVYRDVFPNTPPHLTEFCQQLTTLAFRIPSGSKVTFPPSKTTDLRMITQSCGQHNCIDEYCPDYDEIIRFSMRHTPALSSE
jgi:hypothetical protein